MRNAESEMWKKLRICKPYTHFFVDIVYGHFFPEQRVAKAVYNIQHKILIKELKTFNTSKQLSYFRIPS